MPKLVAPTVEPHSSFLEAMAEFRTEGRGGPGDESIEANGGVLEDERHGKLRFWVPTLPA